MRAPTMEGVIEHRLLSHYSETRLRTGVYVPTRHSAALVNVAVGDRLFPNGEHQSLGRSERVKTSV